MGQTTWGGDNLHEKTRLALKGNLQYTRSRSRTNVLRVCKQRVGLYIKLRADYSVARAPSTLNQNS